MPAPSLFLRAASIPNSFSLTSYLSFTISPNPGYVLNLDNFSLATAKVDSFTGSYTGFYQVRSSVDGFTSAVLSGTISSVVPTFSTASTTLGPSFQNLASVEFRIYIWDSNNGAKNGVLVDNITVVGSVSLIPEPSSLAAAAALGLAGLVAVQAIRGGARLRRARHPRSLRPRG